MSKMSRLLIQCYFVPELVSPALCFLCLLGFMLCMQRMRHRGEVKRGAGMEFCSIYHPEIFLLERHTLFSLSLSLSQPPLSYSAHFSSLRDMRSSHFIPGWLSSALKHCCCPRSPCCSTAAGIERQRPMGIGSCWREVFVPLISNRYLLHNPQTLSPLLHYFTLLPVHTHRHTHTHSHRHVSSRTSILYVWFMQRIFFCSF